MGSSRLARVGVRFVTAVVTVGLMATLAGSGLVAAQEKGNLVVGVTSDPDTLFPWKATQFQAVALLGNVYGSLTELDQDLNVVGGVAETWDTSEDGTVLTLHIRDGVTFHDGKPLTSADVKSSLDQILDEATGAVARASLASIDSVEAPDAQTVVLNLKNADAGILAGLASVNLAILSQDDTEEGLSSAPNGTGPFAFDSRKPNESITLVGNDAYWREGEPSLASVEFRVIPDESSIVDALRSGNVQLAVLDDPLVATTAEGDGITILKTPQLAYHALQINGNRPPLDDLNVRLAITCAVDRQQVLDTAALGEGTVVGPITSPAYRSDPDARPCPTRDVERAKQLLSDAGFPDGITIGTIVSQGEYATSVNEAQNLQAQLAEAGITLELEVMEIGAYVDRWLAADFDTAVALNGGRPDPDVMYGRYFTSDGNLNQIASYSSPELDDLFARGKATSDVAERQQIYADISRHLEDNAVWLWMFSSYAYTATTDGVDGFIPMPNASLQYLRTTTLE